jgi:hypothetical protein
MCSVMTPQSAAARDLALWLEDRETARLGGRSLARKRLGARHAIPAQVFWTARYRASNTLGRWLDRLIAATLAEYERDIDELESTLAYARTARGHHPGLDEGALDEAQNAIAQARRRLMAARQEGQE